MSTSTNERTYYRVYPSEYLPVIRHTAAEALAISSERIERVTEVTVTTIEAFAPEVHA